jgi:hypothetical protein
MGRHDRVDELADAGDGGADHIRKGIARWGRGPLVPQQSISYGMAAKNAVMAACMAESETPED